MTPGLPVVLELVRRIGDLIEPAEIRAALPFAEQFGRKDIDTFTPLEDCIDAFVQAKTSEQWKKVFAAVREEIVIKSADGEELRIGHGDLINIYAVPGFALGVALAMHVALTGTDGEARELRRLAEGGEK